VSALPTLNLAEIPKDWDFGHDTSQHIEPGKWYLYRVTGKWYAGKARITWYGIEFTGWYDSGQIRLGHVTAAYEIPDPPEPRIPFSIEPEDEQ